MNLLRAINDLRSYLAQESPHKLGFLVLSVVLFGAILVGFTLDSRQERVYRREITYVQQWPGNRSDAEIIAQQKIDAPIEAKRKAEEAEAAKRTQQDFKKMDDRLEKLGI